MTADATPEKLRDTMFARWTDPNARPLFKGRLIDDDGCCCAQGDVLRVCEMTDEDLRGMDQREADQQVADCLSWPVWRAILLRTVNDSEDGCPEAVLRLEQPEYARVVFGPQGEHVFGLLTRAQSLSREDATRLHAAWETSLDAAWNEAWNTSRDISRKSSRDASRRDAARRAAWGTRWWDASADAVSDAAAALVVRDLIGQHGFTQGHYDILTGPWRRAIGRIHPDDPDVKGGDE